MNYLKSLLEEYGSLVQNDSTDHIKSIKELVKTTDPERFETTFKEWMINSVANLYNEDKNTNPTCIVLCGDYRFNKNLFGALLLPASYQSEHLPTFDKDLLIGLKDYFITVLNSVNLNRKHFLKIEQLKNFILIDKINVRLPYHKVKQSYPRISNFIATTNLKSNEVIGKRFLSCFDLTEPIDFECLRAMDFSKMWGQAYNILMQRELEGINTISIKQQQDERKEQ
jgi:predicted P-loop ATPase